MIQKVENKLYWYYAEESKMARAPVTPIRIELPLKDRIQKIAAERGTNLSALMRLATKKYLDELEAEAQNKIAA